MKESARQWAWASAQEEALTKARVLAHQRAWVLEMRAMELGSEPKSVRESARQLVWASVQEEALTNARVLAHQKAGE